MHIAKVTYFDEEVVMRGRHGTLHKIRVEKRKE
jgi:hypothetical protein